MKDIELMDERCSIFDRIEDLIILLAIIVVLILKLIGVIKISWLWLLCPIWGCFAISILALIGVGIYTLIVNIKNHIEYKRSIKK